MVGGGNLSMVLWAIHNILDYTSTFFIESNKPSSLTVKLYLLLLTRQLYNLFTNYTF